MIHGFTSNYGRVLQVEEFCTVSDSGRLASYTGSVDLRMGENSTMRTMWTYHEGIFDPAAQVSMPDEPGRAKIIRTSHLDGTSSICIYTNPGLGVGEEAHIDTEAHLIHPTPLRTFRRTSGKYGLKLLSLEVFFDGGSLPARVWQCEWGRDWPQHRPVPLLNEKEVTPVHTDLDNLHSVVKLQLEDVPPNRTHGFRWEW